MKLFKQFLVRYFNVADWGVSFQVFTNHDHHQHALTHIFEHVCNEKDIEHRKTKVKHPWTNGQVERMNRTLKEATVNSFYYTSHNALKEHLHAYLMAYNFAQRLKAIKGKIPW